jgi:hypothetical protein
MAVTALTGLVDTATPLSSEQVVDMDNEIKMLDPDESQFTTMLMTLGSTPAVREQINWLEDQLFPRLTTIATSATSAATTLVVATGTGAYFRAKDIVRVASSGEAFLVSSVATDTLTIIRGLGGVAAATAQTGVDLLIVGNAAAQGATLGTRHITKKVLGYNYTQIQRDPFGFTGTESVIETYGGPAPMHEEVKKLVEHKRAIEQTCFWGARSFNQATFGGAAPNSLGTCGGAVEYISTNITNVAGTLAHSAMDVFLQSGLQNGSKNKVLYCAPTVARAISGFLKTAWNPTQVGDRKFGAKVDAYISGAYGWEVPVVVKRAWNDFSSANTQYGSWAFLLDMDYIKLRPLRERNTQLLRNRQANDADEVTHEYRTEYSLEFAVEKVHAIMKGVTG